MIIELKKGHNGPPTLSCVRADGTRTWGKLHPFFLVASGWNIDDFATPGAAGRLPMEARWAESIVGLLDLERGTGIEWSASEFNEALAESLRGQGVASFRPIAEAELAQTRSLRGELQRRWEDLPQGGTLAVPFPLAGKDE